MTALEVAPSLVFGLVAGALAYAVAAALIASIGVSLSTRREEAPTTDGVVTRTVADIREGLAFLWHQPVVRALTLFGFGQSMTAGAVTGLLVVFAVDGLGLDAGSGLVGAGYVAVAVGGLLLVAWSASSVLAIVNGITARQQVTPDALQSRVNTTARMIAWGGAPVGALAGGVLATVTDVRTAYLLAAVGVTCSAVLAARPPLRRRELVTAGS